MRLMIIEAKETVRLRVSERQITHGPTRLAYLRRSSIARVLSTIKVVHMVTPVPRGPTSRSGSGQQPSSLCRGEREQSEQEHSGPLAHTVATATPTPRRAAREAD